MASERLTTWLAAQRVDGKVVVRLGRRGDELIAEFSHLGTFAANVHGSGTRFEPVPEVKASLLDKLDEGKLDALTRHILGKLTLHGGAVGVGSKAVAFVGPSRAGKSTLAAALCTHSGAELVADDTVALELPEDVNANATVEVLPTQKLAWLLPDAREALGLSSELSEKASVPLRVPSADRLELMAIVGLGFEPPGRGTSLRRLHGQEAFALLTSSIIRFVVDDPAAQVREFEQVRLLVDRCPVFELRRPPDLGALGRSIELLRPLLGLAGDPEGAA